MPLPALAMLGLSVAPEIGRLLFGSDRAATATELVVDAVRTATGTSDPAEAEAKVLENPALASELRARLYEIKSNMEIALAREETERYRAELSEKQSTRQWNLELARQRSPLAWMPAYLTAALALSFFALIWALLYMQTDFPAGVREVLLVLSGVLVSEFKGACQYWLGTSRGAVEMRQGLQRQEDRRAE